LSISAATLTIAITTDFAAEIIAPTTSTAICKIDLDYIIIIHREDLRRSNERKSER